MWKNINHTLFERKKRKPDLSQKECISWNIEKLSHLVGMKNISNEVNEEFSKIKKYSLVEMFTAVNELPSYFERLYSRTINGPQSRMIMLALNIVNKSPKKFKPKAKLIFSKLTSIISKKYQNQSSEKEMDLLTLKGNINLICTNSVLIEFELFR